MHQPKPAGASAKPAQQEKEVYDASYVLQRAAPGLSIGGPSEPEASTGVTASDVGKEEEVVAPQRHVEDEKRTSLGVEGEKGEGDIERASNDSVLQGQAIIPAEQEPSLWEQVQDEESGDMFWYNGATGESRWSPPPSPELAPSGPAAGAE